MLSFGTSEVPCLFVEYYDSRPLYDMYACVPTTTLVSSAVDHLWFEHDLGECSVQFTPLLRFQVSGGLVYS